MNAAIRALLTLAVAGVAAVAAPVAAGRECEPVGVPMQVTQVAPHSYDVLGQAGMVSHANPCFDANAGFVVTADGVVVFDTLGTPALGSALG